VNRKRMRTFVTILIVLALTSGGAVTLVSVLRGTTVDEPISVLSGVTLSPQDFKDTGLGTAVDVQYASKTFVFFADSQGAELANAKGGLSIDFRGGGSVTLLCGQFAPDPNHALRDQAYAWYRDKLASDGLVVDAGTAIVGDGSARYDDPAVAAMLVRKNNTVFTLVYALTTTTTTTTPRPIVAAEALARLLASRF